MDSILPEELIRDLEKTARFIRKCRTASVYTHIDADGISAGSIASMTLERLGISHEVHFEKKLSDESVERINSDDADLVWICDLGSSALSKYTRSGIVITDHHVPDPLFRKNQTFIDSFVQIYHLNPHVYGADGSIDVSGSGMTYLLSKYVDQGNTDLAYIAIIGALGDFQDDENSSLIGWNRPILADAVETGDVTPSMDIRFFGRTSRPLAQFLQYGGDNDLGGLSNNRDACNIFLSDLGIHTKDDDRWRVWNDLSEDEKSVITTALMDIVPAEKWNRVYGEVYGLPKLPRDSGLSDGKEFATALNSCGRYDDADTGMRLCKGDLSALKDADRNRAEHRKNISSALSYVKDNHLIRERMFVQYFDAGSEIRETVVGIVAGMILSSEGTRQDLPILAFADAEDGVKVSARISRYLSEKGVDLSVIMKKAAEMVGGYGGGHSVAAGATIPPEKKEDFIQIVEDLVVAQLT